MKENRKKGAKKELVALVVVEVGKSILEDARLTFGEPGVVIRYLKTVNMKDIPKIAAEVYQGILLVLRELRKEGLHEQQITLVLSGPVSLSFQIGQAIGFHYNIQLVHWVQKKHDYQPVPAISRKILDSFTFEEAGQQKQTITKEPIIAIDVGGKGVFAAVKKHFGGRTVKGVSYSEIDMVQVPTIAAEVYHKVATLGITSGEIGLALSGPLVLNLQIGEVLGFHYKVKPYQWQAGKYLEVPPLTREMLAGTSLDANSQ